MYLAFFSFNCYALSFPSHFYQNLTSQNRFMASQFGASIKELREKKGIFHRQVAALLDMDSPLFSKIERGESIAKKEIVLNLAMILKFDKDQLLSLWLADQVLKWSRMSVLPMLL